MTEPGEGLDPEDAERLFELIGQAMATALRNEDPDANGYRARPLPEPDRNEAR